MASFDEAETFASEDSSNDKVGTVLLFISMYNSALIYLQYTNHGGVNKRNIKM